MQLPLHSSDFSEIWHKLPQIRIAQMIIVVSVIYIAFVFAQMTWLFVDQDTLNTVTTKSSSTLTNEQQKLQIDTKAIQRLNLFGLYEENKKVETVQVQDAPETSLRLTLSGTVASDAPNIAAAIIENNGKQETYGIGDKITGTRATLEQVTFDRVIIKHLGKLETLMLDGFKYNKNSPNISSKIGAVSQTKKSNRNLRKEREENQADNVVDQRFNEELSRSALQMKADIHDDPASISDYLKIVPKRVGGKIVGYRLMPGQKPEFFQQSGLKAGDVAIQINGLDLTVPSDAVQALEALKQAQELSLLVDRNGEINEILFSITSEL